MEQFEYDVVAADDLPDAMALADVLNAKAAEGWRLVSDDGFRCIFERPRQPEGLVPKPRER